MAVSGITLPDGSKYALHGGMREHPDNTKRMKPNQKCSRFIICNYAAAGAPPRVVECAPRPAHTRCHMLCVCLPGTAC
jgi:hypothetical protein